MSSKGMGSQFIQQNEDVCGDVLKLILCGQLQRRESLVSFRWQVCVRYRLILGTEWERKGKAPTEWNGF